MTFGVNLGFAVKRWPEPEAWCRFVREDLGLSDVQMTFDLLDPQWPSDVASEQAAHVRRAAERWDIRIHSAFAGIAAYTYNGLLHPDRRVRQVAIDWWKRAATIAVEMGAESIGGPLGGLSLADAADDQRRARLHEELSESMVEIVNAAERAGVREFLIEPTPLVREIPHLPGEAMEFCDALADRVSIPVRYVIDVGHALFQPLYGPDAGLAPWLETLGNRVGMLHLQNTDFQSDSHWGWPDSRGQLDVGRIAGAMDAGRLAHVPVFLEVFYPFEMDDTQVARHIASSVEHCLQVYGARAGT